MVETTNDNEVARSFAGLNSPNILNDTDADEQHVYAPVFNLFRS